MKDSLTRCAIAALVLLWSSSAVAGRPDHARAHQKRPVDQVDRVIVKFRPGVSAGERAAVHRRHRHEVDRILPQLDIHTVLVPPGKTIDEVIAGYSNHPLVEFVEPETFMEPTAAPNDPAFRNAQIPIQLLGIEAAWDMTTGSPDVPIAVLDTGLDYTHYEFIGRAMSGFDFADNDGDYYDPFGHGTLVTGVISAMSNNEVGMAGVCWQNPVMVLRTGFGFDAREAIVWAADNGARVISMSFGGYIETCSWEATCQYAMDRGVVLVGSAGNDGVDWPFYPAAYPTVLAVTGVNNNGEPVGFNWGEWIDLSAPGGGVLTTKRLENDSDGDGLGFGGGTSIAAPVVAAAAGLVLSANPELGPAQVMQILRDTADDLGDPGFDVLTGHGKVNFAAAVERALGTSPPPPDTTPPIVQVVEPLQGAVLSGATTILVSASDDTRVARVDLYCDGSLVSSDTVAPHEWTFDTTQLANGEHVFRAVAHDTAANSAGSDPVCVTVDNGVSCDCPPDCSEPAASEHPSFTCLDGLDNDCDGVFDCDDPDCDADEACAQPSCNHDGVCGAGEDCVNCPGDCIIAAGASCGNAVCEASDGEDCLSCPDDCNGQQGGRPSQRFCCGGGAGSNPVDCADLRCNGGGFACTAEPAGDSCCGDGICANAESGCNCPIDCGSAPSGEAVRSTCRDRLDNDCDGAVDCDDSDCATDPDCFTCNNNGVCEIGEDCRTCPDDCPGKTKGKKSSQLSGGRFCCGNGVLEGAEGDGSLCDGNP